MLGEVNLAHATGAEQPLDHIPGEDVTAVQRHDRKPTGERVPSMLTSRIGNSSFPSVDSRFAEILPPLAQRESFSGPQPTGQRLPQEKSCPPPLRPGPAGEAGPSPAHCWPRQRPL